MSESRFYVQRPVDEYGNSWHAPAVIEAFEVDLFGPSLRVTAPAEFAADWPTVRTGSGPYASWVETEGPARMLDHEEWEGLIETLDILADPDTMAAIAEGETDKGIAP